MDVYFSPSGKINFDMMLIYSFLPEYCLSQESVKTKNSTNLSSNCSISVPDLCITVRS